MLAAVTRRHTVCVGRVKMRHMARNRFGLTLQCFALLGLTAYSHAAPPSFDLSLIKGEPASYVQMRGPFLATFEKDGFQLDYVAGSHEFSQSGPTMTLVKQLLARTPPDFVIIEGIPKSMGVSSQSYLEHARKNCNEQACPAGETAFTAIEAADLKIPFQGGEPDEDEVAAAVKAAGVSAQNWLAYDFVRNVGWRKDQPGFAAKELPALFKELAARPEHREAAAFTLSDFKRWYRKASGKRFDALKFDVSAEEGPNFHGTIIQRITALTNAARDRSAIGLLAEVLPKYRHVMIVYARGHYDDESAALEQALGKPRVSRP